jgi:hypothetical protein
MALILSGVIAAAWSGCVLDSNRCGPNEMIYPGSEVERCICVENAANTGTGCVLCGENEVPGGPSCVCAPGFVRGTGGACEAAPAGLGAPCSATMPCTDATFTHCATSANGQGYCTTAGCTDSTQCTNGYACDLTAATPYCKRPPVGAGMSCTSNTDCAGTEATYCDTFVQHACLVEGCAVSPNNCFSGTECCDLSGFGIPMPICIPAGACMQ